MAVEIERKFLVTDDSYKQQAFACDRIAQGYICRQGGNSARVRVRGDKGYLTIKAPRSTVVSAAMSGSAKSLSPKRGSL